MSRYSRGTQWRRCALSVAYLPGGANRNGLREIGTPEPMQSRPPRYRGIAGLVVWLSNLGTKAAASISTGGQLPCKRIADRCPRDVMPGPDQSRPTSTRICPPRHWHGRPACLPPDFTVSSSPRSAKLRTHMWHGCGWTGLLSTWPPKKGRLPILRLPSDTRRRRPSPVPSPADSPPPRRLIEPLLQSWRRFRRVGRGWSSRPGKACCRRSG